MPVLPGHPRGGALHPGPGPAAVRDARRARRLARSPTAGAPTEVRTRSTCAWPARAARPTARPTSTWPPTRPSSSPTTTGPPAARRAPTTALGWLPAGRRGVARLRLAAAGQRAHPGTRRCAALATRLGGLEDRARSRCSPRRPCSSGAPPARPARPTGPRGARCCCGRTRSPTTSTRTSARPPSRCSRRPAGGSSCPAEPLCCGLTWISTGQLATAKRVLQRTVGRAGPARPARRPRRRARAELHRRVPLRRARAVPRRPGRRSGCATTPSRWPSCCTEHTAGWQPPRAGPARRSPRCTATSTPSWAGTPTSDLLEQAGRRRRAPGLRLLRPGRQLRLRGRPRRGQPRPAPSGSCCPRLRDGRRRTPSSWPTASAAAPRSTSSTAAAARPCTSPSCSPPALPAEPGAGRRPPPRPAPGRSQAPHPRRGRGRVRPGRGRSDQVVAAVSQTSMRPREGPRTSSLSASSP